MAALPIVRETRVRDRRGIYHRRVWLQATGFRSLICEQSMTGTVEVPYLPDDVDEWQLCGTCFPPRSSDVLA